MVLTINGIKVEEIPSDSRTLYHLYPGLKESAEALISSGGGGGGQVTKINSNSGLLYVSQREFAAVSPHDKNISIIGTDDCTTCLAVILRHSTSGATALGHFENVCVDGISLLLNRISELSPTNNNSYFHDTPEHPHSVNPAGNSPPPIHLHIIGSFSDKRGYSEELIYNILSYIHKESYQVELVTACVGAQNTVVRGDNVPWPIVYGVAVNVKSGQVFSAHFPLEARGPDISLRQSRIFSGSNQLLEIYDYNSGLLRIGPFHYEPLRCASIMLDESDEFILQHLTTSPEVEPSHTVSEIKSTLRHIQEHPFPEITIFADNRPRYYRKDNDEISAGGGGSGGWSLLRLDHYHHHHHHAAAGSRSYQNI